MITVVSLKQSTVLFVIAIVARGALGQSCGFQSRDEQLALTRIEELGGRVSRDSSLPGQAVVAIDLAGCRAEDDDMKLIAMMPHVRDIDVSYTYVTGRGLRWLAASQSLESLWARALDLKDADLQCLACVPQLRHLGIASNPGLSGRGFRYCVFRCLEQLDMSDCGVQERSLMYLPKACPRLKSLYMQTDLPVAACFDIARIQTLEELVLHTALASDQHLAALAGLSNLQILEISDCNVTDTGLQAMAGATKLRVLDVGNTKVTGEAVRNFAGLESLYIGNPLVNDDSLRHISSLSQLRDLHISCATITKSGIRQLAECTSLRSLSLYRINLESNSLGACANVGYLELWSCQLNNDAMLGMDELTNLHTLVVRGCNISDEDLNLVAHIPNLEELEIQRCENLTDASVPTFLLLARLRSIKSDLSHLSKESKQLLRDKLKNLKEG